MVELVYCPITEFPINDCKCRACYFKNKGEQGG